jgi:Pvc16 N-terminal domain
MSNHIAIAAVTATLKMMIQAEVSKDPVVAGGKVTALPPDKARTNSGGNQVNLFLFRTSIDPAWRNMDPPGMRPGENGQPPLPLVLTYLITAYGDADDEILGHRLLGIAMGVLNDQPILSRQDIADIKAPDPAAGSDLDKQVESVRITPDPRSQDEISRMWTTFGTGYRLSVSYDAAVLLIDRTQAAIAPLPVLERGAGDTGPTATVTFPPQIDMVLPPGPWGAARPGDVVTLVGRNLAAASAIQVTGMRLAAPVSLQPQPGPDGALSLQIPDPASAPAGTPTLPAGTVALAPMFDAGIGAPVPGPQAPLALAPTITNNAQLKAKLDAQGNATVTVTCQPAVQPGQTVALVVGQQVVPGASPVAASNQLSFDLTGLTKKTTYALRLRVDSVDSIPLTGPPPVFTNPNDPEPMSFDPTQTLLTS